MSHEISEFAPGTFSFAASNRQAVWHRLGQSVDGAMTAQEALEFAHLANWNVRKTQLFTYDENNEQITAKNRFATIFTNPISGNNEFLGDVGSHYVPIQNEAHVDLLNAIVDESGAIFDTAGSLAGGKRVFISMQLPDTMKVGGVDDVKMNLVAMNSHDGSTPFRFMVTPVRVVCANTLAAAFTAARSRFSIRHVANPQHSLQEAREALKLTFEYVNEFEEAANALISKQLDDDKFSAMLSQLFQVENAKTDRQLDIAVNNVLGVKSTLAHSQTLTGIEGTAWAGYQAITEYLDHFANVRGPESGRSTALALKATSDAVVKMKEDAFAMLAR